MGRASRFKQVRQMQRESAELVVRRQLLKMQGRLAEDPEFAAFQAAIRADTGLHERWQADAAEQVPRLKRAGWRQAWEGGDGIGGWGHADTGLKMIHSAMRWTDGELWGHISLSRRDDTMPDWYELSGLHRLMYPDLSGMQVLTPRAGHVNIAEVAHSWTCLTAAVIPDFGKYGTI